MCCVLYFRPETQVYIQRMEQEKADKVKGQESDNRSFFAKYVSIFIFVVLCLTLTG